MIPDEEKSNQYAQLAIIKYKNKEFSEAIKYCNASIKTNPENYKPLYIKGLILIKAGRSADALDYLTKSLSLCDNSKDKDSILKAIDKISSISEVDINDIKTPSPQTKTQYNSPKEENQRSYSSSYVYSHNYYLLLLLPMTILGGFIHIIMGLIGVFISGQLIYEELNFYKSDNKDEARSWLYSPSEWCLMTILIWILAYPYYLWKRRELFDKNSIQVRRKGISKPGKITSYACIIFSIIVIFALLVAMGSSNNQMSNTKLSPQVSTNNYNNQDLSIISSSNEELLSAYSSMISLNEIPNPQMSDIKNIFQRYSETTTKNIDALSKLNDYTIDENQLFNYISQLQNIKTNSNMAISAIDQQIDPSTGVMFKYSSSIGESVGECLVIGDKLLGTNNFAKMQQIVNSKILGTTVETIPTIDENSLTQEDREFLRKGGLGLQSISPLLKENLNAMASGDITTVYTTSIQLSSSSKDTLKNIEMIQVSPQMKEVKTKIVHFFSNMDIYSTKILEYLEANQNGDINRASTLENEIQKSGSALLKSMFEMNSIFSALM